ncbi:MAG: hypothetical protein K8S98_03440 [Planctomycetes bacterium]|nr:hypothetical protein [Planctomycetota bacterium]
MLVARTLFTLFAVAPFALADGRQDFEASLAKAQKLGDAGKWADARKATFASLQEHDGQAYVREHLDDVKALLTRSFVEIACPPRKLDDVLCGEVVAYDAKKGDIELRYKQTKPKGKDAKSAEPFPCGDFEVRAADHDLIVPFVGPYTAELRGSALGSLDPFVRVAVTSGERYEVALRSGNSSQILHYRGDRAGASVAGCTDIVNCARPYVIKVVVGKATLEAYFNGKRLLSAGHELDDFGRLGFRDLLGLEEIRVSGKVDVAWVDERVKAANDECRSKVEKEYDVSHDLPKWLQ